MSRGAGALLAWALLASSGCGAVSLRLLVAPMVDTRGHVGVEASVEGAFGWPLTLTGQSHHFIQASGRVGGGVTDEGHHVAVGGWLDTLHWVLPDLDLRIGAGFARRFGEANLGGAGPGGWSAGGRFAVLPSLMHYDGSHPMNRQLLLGPELRVEALWLDSGETRGLISLPLVFEAGFLAAGD